jgi:hypothetical protein
MNHRELLMEDTPLAIWVRLADSIWELVYRARPGGRTSGAPLVRTAPINGLPPYTDC